MCDYIIALLHLELNSEAAAMLSNKANKCIRLSAPISKDQQ